MLFISLLFMVAGMSLIVTAGVMITYIIIFTGERISIRRPREWPSAVKKWARFGAYGLGSVILGMIAAMIATG